MLLKQKAESGKEITILAIWDSITFGYKVWEDESYPSQLEEKFLKNWYNYSIENFGISGDTSSGLLERLDDILELSEADIAILCIWGNDGLRKKSVSTMKKNIEIAIQKIQAKNIQVVLVGMELPIIFGWDYTDEFALAYSSLAEKYDLDFYPYLLEWIGLTKEYNQPDNIHPTALGYTLISDNLYEFFEEEKLLYKK